jgi:Ni/Co efflux regulator RcnB
LLPSGTNFNRIKKLFAAIAVAPASDRQAGSSKITFHEDPSMNKLLLALIAGVFALGTVAAYADDKTPAQPVDQQQLKEQRAKAKAEKANMTPEQKKAKRAMKQKETSGIAAQGDTGNKMEQQKADKAAAQASKGQPKLTKEEKQKALKEQEKKSSGQ